MWTAFPRLYAPFICTGVPSASSSMDCASTSSGQHSSDQPQEESSSSSHALPVPHDTQSSSPNPSLDSTDSSYAIITYEAQHCTFLCTPDDQISTEEREDLINDFVHPPEQNALINLDRQLDYHFQQLTPPSIIDIDEDDYYTTAETTMDRLDRYADASSLCDDSWDKADTEDQHFSGSADTSNGYHSESSYQFMDAITDDTVQ